MHDQLHAHPQQSCQNFPTSFFPLTSSFIEHARYSGAGDCCPPWGVQSTMTFYLSDRWGTFPVSGEGLAMWDLNSWRFGSSEYGG